MSAPKPQKPPAHPAASTAWSRRRMLSALVYGAAGALLPSVPERATPAAAVATPAAAGSLAERGICYDTGTDYLPGSGILTIETWDVPRVTSEIAVLHRDLHCNAVTIFGSDPDRLREAAEIALAEGMRVWIQPRPIDADAAALRDVIAGVAATAEELRQEYGAVGLNLGVELTIFSAGIIPGTTFADRITTLLTSFDSMPTYNAALNALLGDLRETARAAFNGPLTYGSLSSRQFRFLALFCDFRPPSTPSWVPWTASERGKYGQRTPFRRAGRPENAPFHATEKPAEQTVGMTTPNPSPAHRERGSLC